MPIEPCAHAGYPNVYRSQSYYKETYLYRMKVDGKIYQGRYLPTPLAAHRECLQKRHCLMQARVKELQMDIEACYEGEAIDQNCALEKA
mgnify:FL=1